MLAPEEMFSKISSLGGTRIALRDLRRKIPIPVVLSIPIRSFAGLQG